jgi:putative FmdB family regulatory protein
VPTYDYQCRGCGKVTEVIHSMLDDGPSTCEVCGGQLRRVLYPTGIIFRGSGFYRTDSRATQSASSPSSEGKSSSDGKAPDGGTGAATGDAASPKRSESAAGKTASTESTAS